MNASMIIKWVSKCMILKVSGLFIFTLYFFFLLLFVLQILYTMIRRRVSRRLIVFVL